MSVMIAFAVTTTRASLMRHGDIIEHSYTAYDVMPSPEPTLTTASMGTTTFSSVDDKNTCQALAITGKTAVRAMPKLT